MEFIEKQQASRGRIATSVANAAKCVLPRAAVGELRRLRGFSLVERSIYLRVRLNHCLTLARNHVPSTARSFLFLCYGNIMRSPMCEALMNRELAAFGNGQYIANSAGLNATPGRPAHPWAIAAAREFGISLERHSARLLTREMVDHADAIFVMDYQNYVQLVSRWEPDARKIFMLRAFADHGYRGREIADPYYLGEEQTRSCYRMLDTCTKNLILELSVRIRQHGSA